MATKAAEIMTRKVVCVSPDTRACDAFDLMRREVVRHLPVLEDARLVGIVSDRDLIAVSDDTRTVGNVMTRAPITCTPKTSVGRLAEIMVQMCIDSIPIVTGDELVGIVTSVDLLQLLVQRGEPLSDMIPLDFAIRTFSETGVAVRRVVSALEAT